MTKPPTAGRPNAVHDLVDADRELALLRELIQAASSGPGVEPLAAAAARMITAATGTDVCFVHVLDDTNRSLTLTGATLNPGNVSLLASPTTVISALLRWIIETKPSRTTPWSSAIRTRMRDFGSCTCDGL